MDIAAPDKLSVIRDLNDKLRRTLTGGQVVTTATVAELPDMVKAEALHKKAEALHKMATFDAFTEDNDPHREHDFGAFELCSRKFFWKIDYYAPDMEHGSEDPADPAKTKRVLTLMLAEDW